MSYSPVPTREVKSPTPAVSVTPTPSNDETQSDWDAKDSIVVPSEPDNGITAYESLQHLLYWRVLWQRAEDFFVSEYMKRYRHRNGEIITVIVELDDFLFPLVPNHRNKRYYAVHTSVDVGHFLYILKKYIQPLEGRFIYWSIAQIDRDGDLAWKIATTHTTFGELTSANVIYSMLHTTDRTAPPCWAVGLGILFSPVYLVPLLPYMVATQLEGLRCRIPVVEVVSRSYLSWVLAVLYLVAQLVLPYLVQLIIGVTWGWAVAVHAGLWTLLFVLDAADGYFYGPPLAAAASVPRLACCGNTLSSEADRRAVTPLWGTLSEVLSVVYVMVRAVQVAGIALVSTPPQGISWPWSPSSPLRKIIAPLLLELRPFYSENGDWSADSAENASLMIAFGIVLAFYLIVPIVLVGLRAEQKTTANRRLQERCMPFMIFFTEICYLPVLRVLIFQLNSERNPTLNKKQFLTSAAMFAYLPLATVFHTLLRDVGYPALHLQGSQCYAVDKLLVFLLCLGEALTSDTVYGKWTWIIFSVFLCLLHLAGLAFARPLTCNLALYLHLGCSLAALIPWLMGVVCELHKLSTAATAGILAGSLFLTVALFGAACCRPGSTVPAGDINQMLAVMPAGKNAKVAFINTSTQNIPKVMRLSLEGESEQCCRGDEYSDVETQSVSSSGPTPVTSTGSRKGPSINGFTYPNTRTYLPRAADTSSPKNIRREQNFASLAPNRQLGTPHLSGASSEQSDFHAGVWD